MFKSFKNSFLVASAMSAALFVSTAPAASADLGGSPPRGLAAAESPWSFTFNNLRLGALDVGEHGGQGTLI